MKSAANLIGQVFERWTIVSRSTRKHRRVLWVCKCACGNTAEVVAGNLRHGLSRSCGCLKAEAARARCSNPATHPARKHGHARNWTSKTTPEYGAWQKAKFRCSNPNDPFYPDYGGRGITMCQRWRESFEAFLADMGTRPGPGYSLDRIDNDRGYEPGNCRWATALEQAANRRPKGAAKAAREAAA